VAHRYVAHRGVQGGRGVPCNPRQKAELKWVSPGRNTLVKKKSGGNVCAKSGVLWHGIITGDKII
jgi:hypothetical protein